MGQRLIDVWARGKVGQPFVWGKNDCHWLLYDFVKISNVDWTDPNNMAQYRGKYTDRAGANELVKTLDIKKELKQAGYTEMQPNKTQTGDIVCVQMRNSAYDMYMPVIFNRTVLVGDPMSKSIVQQNMDTFTKPYTIFRREV